MKLKNFKIEGDYALEYNDVHLDIHNNYDCSTISINKKYQTLQNYQS